jgi:hypothetical protein
MFITPDSFLILFLMNGREPLGYKHFVPNGTFFDRLYRARIVSLSDPGVARPAVAYPWLLSSNATRLVSAQPNG